jgi:hypothetical protein
MGKTYLESNEVESLEKTATCLRDRLIIRLLYYLHHIGTIAHNFIV